MEYYKPTTKADEKPEQGETGQQPPAKKDKSESKTHKVYDAWIPAMNLWETMSAVPTHTPPATPGSSSDGSDSIHTVPCL